MHPDHDKQSETLQEQNDEAIWRDLHEDLEFIKEGHMHLFTPSSLAFMGLSFFMNIAYCYLSPKDFDLLILHAKELIIDTYKEKHDSCSRETKTS
jgi:hypothetical protein